jgi:hypothetical protein
LGTEYGDSLISGFGLERRVSQSFEQIVDAGFDGFLGGRRNSLKGYDEQNGEAQHQSEIFFIHIQHLVSPY